MAIARKQKVVETEQSSEQLAGGQLPQASYEEVAKLAYGLYLQRGGTHGCDQEDWFKAEEMLRKGS